MSRYTPRNWVAALRKQNQAIDMTGTVAGDFRVERRAPSVSHCARWRCVCAAGHVRYIDGAYLRRPGVAPRCAECTGVHRKVANG